MGEQREAQVSEVTGSLGRDGAWSLGQPLEETIPEPEKGWASGSQVLRLCGAVGSPLLPEPTAPSGEPPVGNGPARFCGKGQDL